ncbi:MULTISPECIES: hypothetical protein [Staphylococcus]|uniref:hypothetical protein n=1 Tax=Staphylococcus TaxID=1279 RepID=UPI000946F15F|nr:MULTISPECIES: hypothetical protein [Staphylococcus]OLF31684.1 hypothetical protein BSZ11_09710 [Staphylococcus sp. 47.1]PIS60890.1 hypothetical protein AZH47_10840 [Corynebacterium striatum]
MNKAMYIYQTSNIVIIVVYMILSYLDFVGTATIIIFLILFIGNNILLIRANRKKVERDGMTIDEYKKK